MPEYRPNTPYLLGELANFFLFRIHSGEMFYAIAVAVLRKGERGQIVRVVRKRERERKDPIPDPLPISQNVKVQCHFHIIETMRGLEFWVGSPFALTNSEGQPEFLLFLLDSGPGLKI